MDKSVRVGTSARERVSASDGFSITGDVRQTVLVVAGLSGFAAMVYQIAWTRALIMAIGSSTYAFTCILAAFILGLGVGSLAVSRRVDHWSRPVLRLAGMELGIGLAAIFIVPMLGRMPAIVEHLVVRRHHDYASLLMAEFGLIIAVTFVPTFLMGAVFPLVVRIVATTDGEAGAAVGRAYAVNTLGTIVGSFLAGFVLIRGDVLGMQYSIVVAALLNAVAAAWLLTKTGAAGRLVPAHAGVGLLGVLAVLGFGLLGSTWRLEVLTSGPFIFRGNELADREVKFFFEDVDTTVSVERYGGEQGSLTLSVNGKADASNGPADVRTQLLLGHVPALLDGDGRHACVIGLGSGMTVAAIARYPSYQRIDCVELSEGVIAASSFFKDETYDVLGDPRVNLIRADGRNHLLLTDRRYDLIVSEPSNPWLAGVSSMFTREFFELCRSRLNPDGVLGIWLQSYSTSERNFRMVLRTLCEVFDSVSIWQVGLADYCLVVSPPGLPLEQIEARFNQPSVRYDLHRLAIVEVGGVLGNHIAGDARIRRWVADAEIHTDDNSLLEFRAPWDLYKQPNVRISRILTDMQESPLGRLVHAGGGTLADETAARISAIISARRLRVEGMRQWDDGRYLQAVDTLVEAHEIDPANMLVFHLLMQWSGELDAWSHEVPAYARAVERIARLAMPVIARYGGTSAEVARLCLDFAREALQQNNLEAAAVYVRHARKLTGETAELRALLDRLESNTATNGGVLDRGHTSRPASAATDPAP